MSLFRTLQVGLLLAAGYYFFFFNTDVQLVESEIKELEAQFLSLQDQKGVLEKKITELKKIRKEFESVGESAGQRILGILNNKVESKTWTGILSEQAKNTGLLFPSVVSASARTEKSGVVSYESFVTRINVTGSFAQVMQYISDVQNLKHFVFVKECIFNVDKEEAEDRLGALIQFERIQISKIEEK